MSRKHHKPYREPWVLDIHRQPSPEESLDKKLDDMMRSLWHDKEYWSEHGIDAPVEPYPGIAAIRRITQP